MESMKINLDTQSDVVNFSIALSVSTLHLNLLVLYAWLSFSCSCSYWINVCRANESMTTQIRQFCLARKKKKKKNSISFSFIKFLELILWIYSDPFKLLSLWMCVYFSIFGITGRLDNDDDEEEEEEVNSMKSITQEEILHWIFEVSVCSHQILFHFLHVKMHPLNVFLCIYLGIHPKSSISILNE